jgi:hypothetical protein
MSCSVLAFTTRSCSPRVRVASCASFVSVSAFGPTSEQFDCQCMQSIVLMVRPAIFARYIPTLDIAGFIQAPLKGDQSRSVKLLRCGGKKPNHRHRRLLRARRERPRRRRAAEQRDELTPSNVTCHAPLPRRHAQSNNITSLFDHSRQLRAGRDTSAEPSTSGRSRASSNRFLCAIGRRDAAQARSATSVINRTDAVQDTRRFRPQPFAGVPRSPYR